MTDIEFRDVSKVSADGTRAVDSLDLRIDEGEFHSAPKSSSTSRSQLSGERHAGAAPAMLH